LSAMERTFGATTKALLAFPCLAVMGLMKKTHSRTTSHRYKTRRCGV
jgi:hypothetical protein